MRHVVLVDDSVVKIVKEMNEVVNIKELNAHIQEESVFVDTLR